MERGGVRRQWVEREDEAVKKAESAGELVKKGREGRVEKAQSTSRSVKKGGWRRRVGDPEREREDGRLRHPPFISPVVQGVGTTPKRCVVT